jgi:SAM-dependent methyltransferase
MSSTLPSVLDNSQLERLSALLACPDDAGAIHWSGDFFACGSCCRRFCLLDGPILDLLPSRAAVPGAAATSPYTDDYRRILEEPSALLPDAVAWGAPESVPNDWAERRRAQVHFVAKYVPSGGVLCDLSAGAGYYTSALAPRFDLVLHCDLSIRSLNYGARRAAAAGLRNMVFLRTDYFRPPFRPVMDVVLCLDSLIRGEAHEIAVLSSLFKCLAPQGIGVVDFHNWWHNPLRRLGLLRQNFRKNRSYKRSEVEHLFRAAGIRSFELFPFSEPVILGKLAWLVNWIVPPTRLVYRFRAS